MNRNELARSRVFRYRHRQKSDNSETFSWAPKTKLIPDPTHQDSTLHLDYYVLQVKILCAEGDLLTDACRAVRKSDCPRP